MNSFMDKLTLQPSVKRELPLAFVRIFVNDIVMGEETRQRSIQRLPKYRQVYMGFKASAKPISKLEL